MDWSKVIPVLQGLDSLVIAAAPLAAMAGPTGAAIGGLVEAGAKVAQSALTEAQAADAVISSDDLATVQAAADSLNAQNNALGAKVDAT